MRDEREDVQEVCGEQEPPPPRIVVTCSVLHGVASQPAAGIRQ